MSTPTQCPPGMPSREDLDYLTESIRLGIIDRRSIWTYHQLLVAVDGGCRGETPALVPQLRTLIQQWRREANEWRGISGTGSTALRSEARALQISDMCSELEALLGGETPAPRALSKVERAFVEDSRGELAGSVNPKLRILTLVEIIDRLCPPGDSGQ